MRRRSNGGGGTIPEVIRAKAFGTYRKRKRKYKKKKKNSLVLRKRENNE